MEIKLLNLKNIFVFCVCLSCIKVLAIETNNRIDCIDNVYVGLMVHFMLGEKDGGQRSVGFDVEKFNSDVRYSGVSYVIFPFGQNGGFYNSGSEFMKNKCERFGYVDAKRDVFGEVALSNYSINVKTIAYMTFRGPSEFGSVHFCFDDSTGEYNPPDIGFVNNWTKLIHEWSVKYGNYIFGWWIDGAYGVLKCDVADCVEYIDNMYCSAFDGVNYKFVAFNAGTGYDKVGLKLLSCQTHTAGEINNLSDLIFVKNSVLKTHIVTYMGDGWSKTSLPRYSPKDVREFLIEFSKMGGGMATFDIGIDRYGYMDRRQLDVLKNICEVN